MSTIYRESKDVPTNVLCDRLDELARAVTQGREAKEQEFTMRVPAELDRDADLVLSEAAKRLRAAIQPAAQPEPVTSDDELIAIIREDYRMAEIALENEISNLRESLAHADARATKAEENLERLFDQLNYENGPTFMGEPVITTPPQPQAQVPDIATMVDRFLSWKLPLDFAPDCGISFAGDWRDGDPNFWPIGTNLFTADQAKSMVEYLLSAVPQSALVRAAAPVPDILPSEAVYGFAAWLTCRDHVVTLGSTCDAAPAADLAKTFIMSQGFEDVRDGIYPRNLKPYPKDNVTSPATGEQAQCKTCTPEAEKNIATIIRTISTERDQLLARVDELLEIINGFLCCPEIADCCPEDKDPDTRALERRAANMRNMHPKTRRE